ncbi:intron-binding protein aquarius-like isoform X1 [Achlya hypogyna]|uniref:Intron-binding protein aquarius-like isoform X1 n=1 Tax=Achlya hypogyna TaxID=1202772 RepID=A0A1V9Z1T8_ACHHY|nr:intron-binding protein aquarius-like isoform X1 [Achlya hypogyna]
MVRKSTAATAASLDELTSRWSPTAQDNKYDASLVASIYASFVEPSDQTAARSTLETTGYLENYLWPHLTEATSEKNLLLSITVLSNEQEGQNWATVDGSKFALFVDALLRLKMVSNDLSLREHTFILRFLSYGIRQLEHSHVARTMLQYASLPVWTHLSEVQRNLAFAEHPKLKRHWQNRVQAKAPTSPPSKKRKTTPTVDLDADFYASLIDDCKECLRSEADDAATYLVHSLNLFIDLLSQLPTRRFLRTLVLHRHLLLACRQSHWITSHELLAKQAELLHFYAHFPIDDQTGHAWTTVEHMNELAGRAHALQLAAFEQSPALHPLSLLPVAQLGDRSIVRQQLATIPSDVLRPFCVARGLLHPADADVDVVECFVDAFTQYTPLSLTALPLYPTETELWGAELAAADGVLPTRKLNLQFLSFTDYLLRQYELCRLEAAATVRVDLETVLGAMQPARTAGGATMFRSRHPLGLALEHVRVVRVGKPAIGEQHPAQVVAQVTLDLAGQSAEVAAAWDGLQPQDVVFLAGVQATNTVDGAAPSASALNAAEVLGIHAVRGAEVLQVFDGQGHAVGEILEDGSRAAGKGSRRTIRVALDGAQYAADLAAGGSSVYGQLNVLVRRDANVNQFKNVLTTMQDLLSHQRVQQALPPWLADVFLGYGDPAAAHYRQLLKNCPETTELHDALVDGAHALASFPTPVSLVEATTGAACADPQAIGGPFTLTTANDALVVKGHPATGDRKAGLRFTPAQVDALRSGSHAGLTLVTGGPGTGKTAVAAQLIANLVRSHGDDRVVVVAPTAAALANLLAGLLSLGAVDPGAVLSLSSLAIGGHDLSVAGRTAFLLQRREALLAQVDGLAAALGLQHLGAGHSVAQARYVYDSHVRPQLAAVDGDAAAALHAFTHASTAPAMTAYLDKYFASLDALGALEIFRTPAQRGDYLLVKHARVVAMTAADAASARARLHAMGFRYATLVMDAAAQLREVDALVPLVLQANAARHLKRVVLLGDHRQLPPAVANAPLAAFSKGDQSLLMRLVRLGAPVVTLDHQGRARPSLGRLFAWHYPGLQDLVVTNPAFSGANAGFRYTQQFVDVASATATDGVNRLEALWIVQLYQYMRHVGYSAADITVLATTTAQAALLRTMLAPHEATFGRPAAVLTVDESQGTQNQFVLLSLVETAHVGTLHDVRRAIVAVSRATLGLYVVGKKAVYESCVALRPVFGPLWALPTTLKLVDAERVGACTRKEADDDARAKSVKNAHQLHEILAALTL